MLRKEHELHEERVMFQRKMKRSREYTVKTVITTQNDDFIDFRMSTGSAVWGSYAARIMIDSTSARFIHCCA